MIMLILKSGGAVGVSNNYEKKYVQLGSMYLPFPHLPERLNTLRSDCFGTIEFLIYLFAVIFT